MGDKSMQSIPAIATRVNIIRGEYDKEQIDYEEKISLTLCETATTLTNVSSNQADVGRVIAALDKLIEVKAAMMTAYRLKQ